VVESTVVLVLCTTTIMIMVWGVLLFAPFINNDDEEVARYIVVYNSRRSKLFCLQNIISDHEDSMMRNICSCSAS